LPEDYFDTMTTHPGGIARLLYYPPPKNTILSSPLSELDAQIGLGAHSDYECFTLLLTSTTPGLEILKPSGQWHIAEHIPGALIVNVADFLMRWTNGLYKSTVHRVVNRSSEARYSVPFFFSVNYDTVIETLPTCLEEGEESKWKPTIRKLSIADSEEGYLCDAVQPLSMPVSVTLYYLIVDRNACVRIRYNLL
jgi:isopenicillin N synthase-like dioxygenase